MVAANGQSAASEGPVGLLTAPALGVSARNFAALSC
jgi:hypothetical protein